MSIAEFQSTYLQIREEGDIVVASFTVSRLDDEANIEEVGQELFAIVDKFGCRKLVLSLSIVEYVTSSLLGKLISLHRRLHRGAGTLVIANLTEGVKDVMRASRLLNYFNIVEDEDEGIQTLK